MNNKVELQKLVEHFDANIDFYKDTKKAYNEHSCRIEFIDPFLKILGWDVANEKGAAPQYREVIAENYSSRSDRPDYTMTLRGVAKFFVEAKKPSVDITIVDAPAIQTRKYGWNAKHRLAVLTNFEFLAIYDTCHFPLENDSCTVARYRLYHYSEYVEKLDEICGLISRSTVYSGAFDQYLDANFPASGGQTQQVDELFLSQINNWRIALSNELYAKGGRYTSLEVLNEYVSGNEGFDTHQGVKGLQFERVMTIIDDNESQGTTFNYEKLFGITEMSNRDLTNQQQGKETTIDRTRRLLYVTCSRAIDSLAIVLYVDQVDLAYEKVQACGWFKADEIEKVI